MRTAPFPTNLRLLIPALGALILAGCGDARPEEPNLLLVVVDTLRADALGCYGNERPVSPRLDELASRGVRYERAYAHSSWTLPSTMSLLTGLTPDEHRVVRDRVDRARFGRLGSDVETLAESLGKAGYATGAIVNNTFLAPEFGFQRGFGTYDYEGALRDEHRGASETVERALAWIEAAPEPWFLLVHVMEPHIEYGAVGEAEGRFVDRSTSPVEIPFTSLERMRRLMTREESLDAAERRAVRGLYDEEVLSVDLALAPLLDSIDLSHDWVAVTSDHGEEFFDHGGFEHGHTLVSAVTRVPMIVAGPDVVPGVRPTIVQHDDLYQTLRELGRAPRVERTSGESLLAIAEGAERTAIMENCLYGSDMLSLVDGDHRFMLQLETGLASVWELDEAGVERRRLGGDELSEHATRLGQKLEAERGNLLGTASASGPSIPDEATFESLRNLGYVGDEH